jgi:glycosyltransferase involved in cell wall biosynthesis
VHGRDDLRAKWGPGARRVLRGGVWLSAHVPHATIVVSRDLVADYRRTYDRETTCLVNAIQPLEGRPPGSLLDGLGLRPGGYVLSVGRLVPEKGLHTLVEAYERVDGRHPLVVVGEPAETAGYVEHVRRRADPERVRFVGGHYGAALAELAGSARLFVTASELEGLPTALIEAALFELPLVATDIPPHREIVDGGPSDVWWCPPRDAAGLAGAIRAALATPWPGDVGARQALRERLLARHAPARVALAHEDLYRRLLAASRPPDRTAHGRD